MLAALLRSLKPGGRLVMLEFQPSNPDAPRGSQTSAHTIALATVETELTETGFEIISRDESFTNARGNRGRRGVQWMLVARRPDDARHRRATDTRSPRRHPWPR
jgi:predicted methyltransferase